MARWIVDDILLDRHDEFGFPNIADAAEQAGHYVVRTKYVPFSTEPTKEVWDELAMDGPTVVYGCIEFVNQLKRLGYLKGFRPGAYFNLDNLKVSTYSPIFGDLMLNNEFLMLPWGEIRRRIGRLPFGNRFFIRPDVVTKTFAGRVIDFDNPADNPEELSRYSPVSDDTLCVMAPVKDILCESRHLIVNKKVITSSQYRYNNVLDIRTDVHYLASDMAEWVADHVWQPDNVYIVDIAVAADGEKSPQAKIIEFNTFSCAGLYAMDTHKVVEAVSRAADREFFGDDL